MNKDKEWIVVADAGGARILERAGVGGMHEVAVLRAPEGEGSTARRAQHADRLPRTHDRTGHARHAIEPHRAPEDVHAERLASDIARRLAKGLRDGAFTQLVLVAPPRFAGRMDAKLDPAVAERVMARYRKDLRRLSVAELEAWLAESV